MRSARLLAVAVLAVVLGLSAAMPAIADINLLQNPGFETGSLAPWVTDCEEGTDCTFGVGSPGHTGTYYAWVGVEFAWGSVYQEIGPPQCAQYLELWYRGGYDTSEGASGVLGVEIYYSDGTTHWQELSQTEEWSFVHIDLDTAKLVKAAEAGVGAVGGGIDIDDFDLEACPAVAVGGVVMPAGMFAILAPWLAAIGVVGCIGTIAVIAKKR
jgi:hypothetical protein